MKRYPALLPVAALVLPLLGAGLAQAQTQPQPHTMTDAAPLPAQERTSSGAVILMDEPVLAQREQMAQAQARSEVDTRTLGAGPARALQRVFTQEEQEQQKLQDARKGLAPPPK